MKQILIKPGHQRHRLWPCMLLLFTLLPVQTGLADTLSEEYTLKAALVYKLTRFVEWPINTDGKPRNHFGICVLGRDDFGTALDALEGRKVGDAFITVQRFNQSEGIGNSCQLVFISDSKRAFLKSILDSFGQRPLLTIGDSTGFAENGGMIQLTQGENRIGFMINLQRASSSGLKIAAPLLDLATIVKSGNAGNAR